ncbi:hypothetical protein [Paraburkholderia ultramafica]|uniref:hypothetical protein n=1 Tax=Paraburkholderia ultramafica TaxID=1544867 RepID=UPI0015825958
MEKQRKALLGSSLLAVYGILQRDDGVATGGDNAGHAGNVVNAKRRPRENGKTRAR